MTDETNTLGLPEFEISETTSPEVFKDISQELDASNDAARIAEIEERSDSVGGYFDQIWNAWQAGDENADVQSAAIDKVQDLLTGAFDDETDLVDPERALRDYGEKIDKPTPRAVVELRSTKRKEAERLEREFGQTLDWKNKPVRSLGLFLSYAVGAYSTTEFVADALIGAVTGGAYLKGKLPIRIARLSNRAKKVMAASRVGTKLVKTAKPLRAVNNLQLHKLSKLMKARPGLTAAAKGAAISGAANVGFEEVTSILHNSMGRDRELTGADYAMAFFAPAAIGGVVYTAWRATKAAYRGAGAAYRRVFKGKPTFAPSKSKKPTGKYKTIKGNIKTDPNFKKLPRVVSKAVSEANTTKSDLAKYTDSTTKVQVDEYGRHNFEMTPAERNAAAVLEVAEEFKMYDSVDDLIDGLSEFRGKVVHGGVVTKCGKKSTIRAIDSILDDLTSEFKAIKQLNDLFGESSIKRVFDKLQYAMLAGGFKARVGSMLPWTKSATAIKNRLKKFYREGRLPSDLRQASDDQLFDFFSHDNPSSALNFITDPTNRLIKGAPEIRGKLKDMTPEIDESKLLDTKLRELETNEVNFLSGDTAARIRGFKGNAKELGGCLFS